MRGASIRMDSYVFLWIPVDSTEPPALWIRRDSHEFLWISMYFDGFLWIPSVFIDDSYVFLWFPMDSYVLCIPVGFLWVPTGF